MDLTLISFNFKVSASEFSPCVSVFVSVCPLPLSLCESLRYDRYKLPPWRLVTYIVFRVPSDGQRNLPLSHFYHVWCGMTFGSPRLGEANKRTNPYSRYFLYDLYQPPLGCLVLSLYFVFEVIESGIPYFPFPPPLMDDLWMAEAWRRKQGDQSLGHCPSLLVLFSSRGLIDSL